MVFLRHFAITIALLAQFAIPIEAFANSIPYGQCLTDDDQDKKRLQMFNKELNNYVLIAKIKAAIKQFDLKEDPNLLKWDYPTTVFFYSLALVQPSLLAIQSLLQHSQDPDIKKLKNYLQPEKAHFLISSMNPEVLKNKNSFFHDFTNFLSGIKSDNNDLMEKVNFLISELQKTSVLTAFSNIDDLTQKLSLSTNLLAHNEISEWIRFADQFKLSDVSNLNNTLTLTEIFRNDLIRQNQVPNNFLLSLDYFSEELSPRLPSLLNYFYPNVDSASTKGSFSKQLIQFLYTRSIEKFLFTRDGFTKDIVLKWLNQDKDFTDIISTQFKLSKKSKAEIDRSADTLYTLIVNKPRVYPQLFDHFVWKSQFNDLKNSFVNEEELINYLTVDSLARTLNAEVESCQKTSHQFEAIGTIIALRSLSIDVENKNKNRYYHFISDEYAKYLITIEQNKLPNFYKNAVSEFGRQNEVSLNPIMSSMPSLAQVVSKPGQFSVWKNGKKETKPLSFWIPQLTKLRYPNDMKVVLMLNSDIKLDGAQEKALCPKPSPIFDQAVVIAEQIVKNSIAYTQKYFFKSQGKQVFPYFYTHGENTTLGANVLLLKDVHFLEQTTDNSTNTAKELNINGGTGGCSSFKLYGEKK